MRRLTLILAAALALTCAAGMAEPKAESFNVAVALLTTGTNTLPEVRGYLDEVHVSVNDGASTGTVALAYVPLDGITAAVNIATNEVIASKVWRPAVDSTTVAGIANTNDPPARYGFAGETVRCIVTGSPTGKTWTVTLKLDR